MKGRQNNDWLVKAIINNTEEVACNWKSYHYGTICQPTGTGKTSEMIRFIADFIKVAKTLGKKAVFNLASHRLNLSFQNAGNIIYTLYKAGLIDSVNTAIVINSSDDTEKYGNDDDLGNFRPLKLNEVETSNKDFYFVVSCYKSHYKLEEKLEAGLFKNYIKICMWDEAHKINADDDDKVNVDSCLKTFDNIYALSATPDTFLNEKLSKREEEINPDWRPTVNVKYIKYMSIRHAIKLRKILPVSFNALSATKLESIGDKCLFCKNAIRKLKTKTGNLVHKTLISADSTDDAVAYFEFFTNEKKAVFMTTSKTGFMTNVDEYKKRLESSNATITDFTDAIKEYDGECVVIHIRQLIEGIDIDCLTSCILFDCPCEENRTNLIQTIGRVLRFMACDRIEGTGLGKDKNDRVKKFGYVVWGMSDADKEKHLDAIADFFIRNYDDGNCEFSFGHSSGGSGSGDTVELADQSTPWQNGFSDILRNTTGFKTGELESVMLDTIDALVKFLRYTKIKLPNKAKYNEICAIVRSRIDDCVQKSYSVEDWANDDDGLIERTKDLMINREPKLEEVFKKFDDFVVEK